MNSEGSGSTNADFRVVTRRATHIASPAEGTRLGPEKISQAAYAGLIPVTGQVLMWQPLAMLWQCAPLLHAAQRQRHVSFDVGQRCTCPCGRSWSGRSSRGISDQLLRNSDPGIRTMWEARVPYSGVRAYGVNNRTAGTGPTWRNGTSCPCPLTAAIPPDLHVDSVASGVLDRREISACDGVRSGVVGRVGGLFQEHLWGVSRRHRGCEEAVVVAISC
jgi:hypothetical protein